MYDLIRFVPLPLMRVVAQTGAWLVKLTNASIYRSIDRNLMLVNPSMADKDRAQLATEALHHQMISTADSLKSWAMPPEWSIKQIKAVHNIEIFKEGLAHPNGMLAIVPHIGTWEMMNAWINQFGKPVIMYKPVKSKAMDRFILQGRQRLNATLVPTDGTGVKAIFKTLKEGGFSIVLPDHVPDPSGGVIVPFFGIPTLTSTLASKLAQKTQCALVGLSCIRRDDNNGFEIFCYRLDDPDLYDKDIEVATQALNNAMQRMIEPHFSHYMWGYRRFKFTPFGENPYLLPFDHLHRQVITYKDGHS
ncbi:lysophospholipid acyltransferase family protein [Moraxella sp.]|uniref:lysophospholipid acyltransferase family protein n=1 Tax=Moraxella sp. TaxID=479 RepID=UPI0026130748|nr:lysophospholipid acyltransferase family protein [Moraxella sp.]MCP3897278.1 lysophospholipid acyltransferase family protein [Moraxella sp.]